MAKVIKETRVRISKKDDQYTGYADYFITSTDVPDLEKYGEMNVSIDPALTNVVLFGTIETAIKKKEGIE